MSEENKTPETVEETTEATEETVEEQNADTVEVAEEAMGDDNNDVVVDTIDIEIPAEFEDIINSIESMSVLQLNQLVKTIEDKWGVSAAAVAVSSGAAGGDAGGDEQTEFEIVLVSDGGAKIPVMKVVKEVLGLGLKEAKEVVESAPASLKTGIKKEEAEDIKSKIEEAGGKVELK